MTGVNPEWLRMDSFRHAFFFPTGRQYCCAPVEIHSQARSVHRRGAFARYTVILQFYANLPYRNLPNSNNLWVWINRSILGGFGRGLVWINRYIRTGGMVVCTGTTRSVVRTVRIVRTVRTTIRTAYRTYCTYCTYCTYQL